MEKSTLTIFTVIICRCCGAAHAVKKEHDKSWKVDQIALPLKAFHGVRLILQYVSPMRIYCDNAKKLVVLRCLVGALQVKNVLYY